MSPRTKAKTYPTRMCSEIDLKGFHGGVILNTPSFSHLSHPDTEMSTE